MFDSLRNFVSTFQVLQGILIVIDGLPGYHLQVLFFANNPLSSQVEPRLKDVYLDKDKSSQRLLEVW